MNKLELFFDISSPWTYLAFESIQSVAARGDVELEWRPFLVGGVFNSVNPSVYESRAKPVKAKARYYDKDLKDWAAFAGLRIDWPPVFPVNSVKIMRGAFYAIEQGCLISYARRAFETYWGDLKDISEEDEIRKIVLSVGLDETEFFDRIAQPAYKDRLRASTDELIARGGFGSPTLFLNGDDMFFGNDRIPLLVHRLNCA